MKTLFRELVFITLCGAIAVLLVQIGDDMIRLYNETRRERQARNQARRDHPSNSGSRYE